MLDQRMQQQGDVSFISNPPPQYRGYPGGRRGTRAGLEKHKSPIPFVGAHSSLGASQRWALNIAGKAIHYPKGRPGCFEYRPICSSLQHYESPCKLQDRSLILCADSLAPCMQLISAFVSLSGPGRTTIQLDGTQVNHCRPCLTQSQSVCWIQNGSFRIYLVIFDVQGGIARSDRSCRQMILLEPLGSGFILFVEICTLIN